MTKRIALTTLASLLSVGLLASGCDTEESSTTEREALLVIDGEPAESLDEVSDWALPLFIEVLETHHETRSASEGAAEGLTFRARCMADCGDHMMSISGEDCACEDGEGCAAIDDGILYEVCCDGQGQSSEI